MFQNQIRLMQVRDGLESYMTLCHLTSLLTLLSNCMFVHNKDLLSSSFVLTQTLSSKELVAVCTDYHSSFSVVAFTNREMVLFQLASFEDNASSYACPIHS